MTGLSKGRDKIFVEGIEAGLAPVLFSFKPPGGTMKTTLTRSDITEEDFQNSELKEMPGFRLSWHYTGLGNNVKPESEYSDAEENQLFIW